MKTNGAKGWVFLLFSGGGEVWVGEREERMLGVLE